MMMEEFGVEELWVVDGVPDLVLVELEDQFGGCENRQRILSPEYSVRLEEVDREVCRGRLVELSQVEVVDEEARSVAETRLVGREARSFRFRCIMMGYPQIRIEVL